MIVIIMIMIIMIIMTIMSINIIIVIIIIILVVVVVVVVVVIVIYMGGGKSVGKNRNRWKPGKAGLKQQNEKREACESRWKPVETPLLLTWPLFAGRSYKITTPTPTTGPPCMNRVRGLHKADLCSPPRKMCHAGAVTTY